MIEVDISNVWNAISLTDLLEVEQSISSAHSALLEGTCPGAGNRGWMDLPVRNPGEEHLRLRKAAEKIRRESDICLVIGVGAALGTRAVMELLQGPDRNAGKGKGDPAILFAGENFSTRGWNRLMTLLEEADFSLIVAAPEEMPLETALAFRALRWKLERKYGSDEAAGRIYAVTHPEKGPLREMANIGKWESFSWPEGICESFCLLTPAVLLPLAVAGLDIMELLSGAMDGKEHYSLGSFENPAWLYGALRHVLGSKGLTTELLCASEPGFRAFGRWWQQLFGGGTDSALLPVPLELTTDLHFLDRTISGTGPRIFETLLRFDAPAQQHIIGLDWRNLDRLNHLEGKPWEFVEEAAFASLLCAHGDAGVSLITMDCGRLKERTVGELVWFLELSCALWAGSLGENPFRQPGDAPFRQALSATLGADPEE